MPTISIVIPIYNAAKFLTATLNSIVNQKHFNKCEMLLINDGSTDNSLKIIRDFENRFPNIRVIDKENEGVSRTRNLGIDQAFGQYLYFMDADDILHPQFLEIILNQIKNSKPDIITWHYSTFYSSPKFASTENLTFSMLDNTDRRIFNALCNKGIAVGLWNKVIAKDIIAQDIRFSPRMTYGEDMFFSWKCIAVADKISYTSVPLYYYRQTSGNASSKYHPGLYKVYRNAFDDIESFLKNRNLFSGDIANDIAYHFACRLNSLLTMELRSGHSKDEMAENIKTILNDSRIASALKSDSRLSNQIYSLARNNDIQRLLQYVKRQNLKSKLLYPIKRILK